MTKLKFVVGRLLVFCGLTFCAGAAFAELLPAAESVPVALYGDAIREAGGKLVGRGVNLDGVARGRVRAEGDRAAVVANPCGGTAEIVWREVRRQVDPERGSHVFYRQHAVGEGLDAELVGSEIVVHRLANGKVFAIGGQQFESVTIEGCAKVALVKAASAARRQVRITKGEQELVPGDAEPVMRELFASRLAGTRLKLVQSGGTFRPAWFTIGDDAAGEPYDVVLDAENERVLAMTEANPGGNCSPGTLAPVSAVGIPVRPEITTWRTMKASTVSRPGPENFTHEAVWIPSDPAIRIIGHHAAGDPSPYLCSYGVSFYTVFPLKITSAHCCSPVYDDFHDSSTNKPLHGRAVGDAMWHTYRTMFVFKYLGWNGWNGAGGDAKVVISGLGDQGQFIRVATTIAPANSVRIGPATKMYSPAASLDLVGHEWGHGVVITAVNFNVATTVGEQMNEGWADVIGTLVEKKTQPAGTGLEQSSDYKMEEDSALNGTYARAALDDDADGISGHDWVGPNGSHHFDDKLHRQDTLHSTEPHATGNMLVVAYRIMAEGGSTDLPSGLNPVCARPNAVNLYAGCTAANAMTASERLGASKTGTLLFYAITHTVPSSTTWTTVADRVNEAAFARYNQCSAGSSFNAAAEQNAVRKAFAGIGYPRTAADIQCP
ncbi:MAG TPA: hypothetical protein VF618_07580 [Thermoanaerobaculia bacterium]